MAVSRSSPNSPEAPSLDKCRKNACPDQQQAAHVQLNAGRGLHDSRNERSRPLKGKEVV